MALTDSLISFWELEEASGTRADSVVASANDLADNNTVTQQTGKVGNCAQFTNANNEYLSRASNASLQTGDIDYTITAWVYLDSVSASRYLVTKDSGGAREYGLSFAFEISGPGQSRFLFYVNDGVLSGINANALGNPSSATWYFIVAWHDAAGNTMNIQVNNGTVNSAAAAHNAATSGEFRIGGRAIGQGAMDGRIDQVGFWKRILTTDERTQLYNAGAGLSYAAMASGPPIPVFMNQYRQRGN